MRRLLLLACALPIGWLAVLGVVLALGIVGAIGIVSAAGSGSCTDSAPDPGEVKGIPKNYLRAYVKAGKRYGIDWAILAAIGSVETDHGRLNAPGVKSGVNSYGCCAGPMQFDKAGTWPVYATDGNGDGKKDIYDPEDAIPAAARYLRASGAPGDYHRAIFAYNHAEWYVADVQARAEKYRGRLKPADLANTGAEAECRQPDGPAGPVALANARAVLNNPRIQLLAGQKTELRAGLIDVRVMSLMVWIARDHTFIVTALRSDHAMGTNHYARPGAIGRAMDIGSVDGKVCNPYGPSDPCGRLLVALSRLKGRMHPTELIGGFDPDGSGPAWAQADHRDHLHVGWDG